MMSIPLLAKTNAISCDNTYQSGTHSKINKGWRYFITKGKKDHPHFTHSDFTDSHWKHLKKFPFNFKDLKVSTSKSGATVWLRCHIELEGRAPDAMSLYLGKLAFSDEVYFNGVRIGRTGEPNQDLSDVEKKRLYAMPGNLWQEGRNTFVIRIRGLTNQAFMNTAPMIVRHLQMERALYIAEIPQIIFSFIYILVAAFFGLFFIFFWQDRQNLFFSLFCLALGIYNIIRTHLRYSLFDSFEASYQMELLVLFLLPVLFSEFYHTLIKIKRNIIFKTTYLLYVLLFVACLFTGDKAQYWNTLIIINIVFMLTIVINIGKSFYKEYKSHYSKLRYLLIGFSLVIPSMVLDVFAALGWHDLPGLTVYGFFFFLSSVSFQLSNSIFDLYHQINEQEKGLQLLEKKRTRSLFNLSNEFNTILEGLKKGLNQNNNTSSRKKTAKKKKGTPRKILKKDIIHIDRSITNLKNLLRDSSMLVSLENKDYNIRNINFNLNTLVKETVNHALMATDQPKKRVTIDIQTELNELKGDPDLLSIALYHLIENALLYSLGEVHILVETESNGDTIVRVRDEGPGIPADMQSTILQKFIRNTQENTIPGSGIGLTIVDLAMQITGGNLRLDNGKGYYCEFTCVFPMEASSL